MAARPILALSILVALSAACSKKDGGEERAEAPAKKRSAATKLVDPAVAGTIEGVVSFTGSAPDNPELPIAEPACAKQHQGGAHQDLVLVQGGKLANAFVYISEGLEDYQFDPPTQEVVIDQVGCVYRPLVVGVQVDQPLTFVNSDPVLHNVHTMPEENRGANFAMPGRGMRTSKKFGSPEIMIATKCDVHPWMRAYIGVVAHPHFAVTGPDGAFRFQGVPPGDHVVALWHEKLGRQTVKVTLADKGTARADFTVSSK